MAHKGKYKEKRVNSQVMNMTSEITWRKEINPAK